MAIDIRETLVQQDLAPLEMLGRACRPAEE